MKRRRSSFKGQPKYPASEQVRDTTHETTLASGGCYQAFSSPEDFASMCERVGVHFDASGWRSRESSAQALKLVRQGDEKRVEAAQAICDQFQNDIDLGQSWPQWETDVCGAYPCVPNYLAGVPETMYRKQVVQSDRAPITIWVCVTSSGGCDADALEKRGIAIQALAMALSVTRQVQIRIFSGLDGGRGDHIMSVDLPSPAVLSQAAFMLASQSFSRGLTYEFLEKATGAGGGWPRSVSHGAYEQRVADWKSLLPIADVDLVFPHVFFMDPDYRDPIAYCKGIFDKVTSGELAPTE
jgi:hypothetical protein